MVGGVGGVLEDLEGVAVGRDIVRWNGGESNYNKAMSKAHLGVDELQ